MANVTPHSQLSTYKCFQRQIRANQEEEEGNKSCQASLNIEKKGEPNCTKDQSQYNLCLRNLPVKAHLKNAKEELQKRPDCIDRNWSMNVYLKVSKEKMIE
ncbi:hypothetical protein O181_080814 [Austropuccinia psidii MF-1]|uniref:Uncharacterized protein n=1 Tax=Austropuccinia psidii MF-1 TaxID=1389203 RepID=A0A9Q3FLM8_9BASI|nr:hypothetical protein [Austropuccinia psidii MF-1]